MTTAVVDAPAAPQQSQTPQVSAKPELPGGAPRSPAAPRGPSRGRDELVYAERPAAPRRTVASEVAAPAQNDDILDGLYDASADGFDDEDEEIVESTDLDVDGEEDDGPAHIQMRPDAAVEEGEEDAGEGEEEIELDEAGLFTDILRQYIAKKKGAPAADAEAPVVDAAPAAPAAPAKPVAVHVPASADVAIPEAFRLTDDQGYEMGIQNVEPFNAWAANLYREVHDLRANARAEGLRMAETYDAVSKLLDLDDRYTDDRYSDAVQLALDQAKLARPNGSPKQWAADAHQMLQYSGKVLSALGKGEKKDNSGARQVVDKTRGQRAIPAPRPGSRSVSTGKGRNGAQQTASHENPMQFL